MTTKHTTHTDDGTRLDIEKRSVYAHQHYLEVQVLGDDGEVYSTELRVEHALDWEVDIDSTRDLTTGLIAEAVANVLDELGRPTGRLVQAKVDKRQTVRNVYGPERDHYEWIDAPEEEFDEAAAERRERSRAANGGGDE